MPRTIANYKPNQPDLLNPLEPRDYRGLVLEIAAGYVGTRDPAHFFETAAPCYEPKDYPSKSWCQIFALCCLIETIGTDIRWRDRLGFVSKLPIVKRSQARPADITILENSKYGNPVWHGNLLVRTDGHFDETIDGNTSEGVAKRRRDIRIYHPRPVYYSIQPLVDAALARDRTPAEPPV